MYAFPEMLSLCGQEWRSEAHEAVARTILLGNSLVSTRDALQKYGKMINEIPDDRIKEITFAECREMGLPL